MTVSAPPDLRASRVIRERRTTRTFRDEQVDAAALARILEAARWAPSAGNRQPVRLIVLTPEDRPTLRALHDIAQESKRISSYWVSMFRPSGVREYVQDLEATPVAIGICADPSRPGGHVGDRDGHVIAAGAAIQNMKLRLHAEGLGAVLYTHWIEEKVKMLLDIPRTWNFVGLLCLGSPMWLDTKERRAALHRKALPQVAFLDRFGASARWPAPAERDELAIGDAILRRRAVRRFTDAPLDDGIAARLLEAGRWAPSAGNFQPWRFVVVRDRAVRARLQHAADLAREVNRALDLEGEPPLDIAGAPLVVATTADPRKGGPHIHGESTHLIGAALAMENMWLQATALGLGAVLVRQVVEDLARAALAIPPDEGFVGLLCAGEPAEDPAAPARAPLDAFVASHGFNGKPGEDPGIAPLPARWRSERGIYEESARR